MLNSSTLLEDKKLYNAIRAVFRIQIFLEQEEASTCGFSDAPVIKSAWWTKSRNGNPIALQSAVLSLIHISEPTRRS